MKLESNVDYKSRINERLSKEYCTWQEVDLLVQNLAYKLQRSCKQYDAILAITNGGIVPSRLMARELNINDIQFIPIINKKVFINGLPSLLKGKKYLVIDEIYDTGNTFSKVLDSLRGFDIDFAFLMSRYRNSNATLVAKILNHNKWVVFPWERKSK